MIQIHMSLLTVKMRYLIQRLAFLRPSFFPIFRCSLPKDVFFPVEGFLSLQGDSVSLYDLTAALLGIKVKIFKTVRFFQFPSPPSTFIQTVLVALIFRQLRVLLSQGWLRLPSVDGVQNVVQVYTILDLRFLTLTFLAIERVRVFI